VTCLESELELYELAPKEYSKQLTARIRSCRTWQDLQPLLAACSRCGDPINLSSGFSTLSRLQRTKKLESAQRAAVHAALAQLIQRARGMMFDFDAQVCCGPAPGRGVRLAQTCASAAPPTPGPDPLTPGPRPLPSRLPQGLASMATALARLELMDEAFVQELMQHSLRKMFEFEPQALANFIWALASMDEQPYAVWLETFFDEVYIKLDQFSSQDVAQTLWGLCRCARLCRGPGARPGRQRPGAACPRRAAGKRAGSGRGEPLPAQQAPGLAPCARRRRLTLPPPPTLLSTRFEVRPPRPLLEALCERALEDMRSAAAAAAAAAAAPGSAPPSGQAPATIMACLARLGYTPPDAWLVRFLTTTQPQLQHYLPMDLVTLVHSCVALSLSPGAAWMAEFYAVLKQRLIFNPTLSYSDFSRLMYSLGRIDFYPDQAWLSDFLELSRPKLARLRWAAQRRALLAARAGPSARAAGCGGLRACLGRPRLPHRPRRPARCRRYRALAELIWAMSCWGCQPDAAWLAAFLQAARSRMDDFRPQVSSSSSSSSSSPVRGAAQRGDASPKPRLQLQRPCGAVPPPSSSSLPHAPPGRRGQSGALHAPPPPARPPAPPTPTPTHQRPLFLPPPPGSTWPSWPSRSRAWAAECLATGCHACCCSSRAAAATRAPTTTCPCSR
jgi:hypothetical protein